MSEIAYNRCIQGIEGLEYETKSFFSLNLLPKQKIKSVQSLRFARRTIKNVNYILDLILFQEGFTKEDCNKVLLKRINKILTKLRGFAQTLRSDLPNTFFYNILYNFFFYKHYIRAVARLEDLDIIIESFIEDDDKFISSEELLKQI
jgi:hypothetical protein